jgi:5-methylcytosine-specific restriction endonuclease McrA
VLPTRGVRVQIPSAAPQNIMDNKEYDKKKYQREWLQARRTTWIQENGPCKVCGTWDNLEVDHIDPSEKQIKISTIWSRSQEVRDKELAKCQVLCKSCHLNKTKSQRKKPEHGMVTMYDNYKCRCDLCKEAKRKKEMKYRNPKKYKELYND